MVMHDTSLDEVCRTRPSSVAELLQVSGFGERKAALYGQQIFAAIERFRNGERASAPLVKKSKPVDETLSLLAEGHTLDEIAAIRGRQLGVLRPLGPGGLGLPGPGLHRVPPRIHVSDGDMNQISCQRHTHE